MKRTIALVLTLLLIAALGVFASSADTVELLPKESEWEFLTYEGEANALPEEEEPELWLSNGEYTGQSLLPIPSLITSTMPLICGPLLRLRMLNCSTS